MKGALRFRQRCTTWILSEFCLGLFSLVHDLYLNLALFHGKVSSLSDLQGICASVFLNILPTSENAPQVQELLLWLRAESLLFIRFQISLSCIDNNLNVKFLFFKLENAGNEKCPENELQHLFTERG